MPREKNFKQLVRSRMAKTGQSYTTARAHFEPTPAAPLPVGSDPDAAALARALAAAGVLNPATQTPYSEPLLFGVAGGIGFAYLAFVYDQWTSINLDGRLNTLYFEKKAFIEVACARLGVWLRVRQMTDPDQTQRHLRTALTKTGEVALTLDLVKIPSRGPASADPYAPRLVTVAGQEPELTVMGLPRGRVTMPWDELLDARWTGAKKYGGLYLIAAPAEAPNLRNAVGNALGRTADCLLEPSRSNHDGNFGVPGIRRWARLLTDAKDKRGWPRLCPDPESLGEALASVIRGLGSPAGSGAGRRLYATFLDEAAALADEPELASAADTYRGLADRWTDLATTAGRPGVTPADLAGPLPDLADAEEVAALSLRAAATAINDGGHR